jgi:ATP-dependent RNA helicase SrmB
MEGIQRYLHLKIEQLTIKGLEARFKGAPTRAKPGKKKLDAAARAKRDKKTPLKAKQRLRDRKNIGKRRTPTTASETEPGKPAGLEPPKRRGS